MSGPGNRIPVLGGNSLQQALLTQSATGPKLKGPWGIELVRHRACPGEPEWVRRQDRERGGTATCWPLYSHVLVKMLYRA